MRTCASQGRILAWDLNTSEQVASDLRAGRFEVGARIAQRVGRKEKNIISILRYLLADTPASFNRLFLHWQRVSSGSANLLF